MWLYSQYSEAGRCEIELHDDESTHYLALFGSLQWYSTEPNGGYFRQHRNCRPLNMYNKTRTSACQVQGLLLFSISSLSTSLTGDKVAPSQLPEQPLKGFQIIRVHYHLGVVAEQFERKVYVPMMEVARR